MTAIIDKLKLAYFSIPKCACTSLKSTMYKLENNTEFKIFSVNSKLHYIHDLYPSLSFKGIKERYSNLNEYKKICFIRDPIERIASAYTNRVKFHWELNEEVMEKYKLKKEWANPTFPQFINKIFEYRKIPAIKHHTDPLTFFVGENTNYFDHIFNIKNMDLFIKMMKENYDINIDIPILQTGGGGSKKIDIKEISIKNKGAYKILKDFTKKDYEVFAKYLNPQNRDY